MSRAGAISPDPLLTAGPSARGHPDRGLDIESGSGPPLPRDPLLYGVALIALTVCAPFFRYVEWLGDEGVLLHGAVRILGGEVLYRDFFEFLAPGGFLIVATWMKLFGAGFASVRVLALGVVAAIAALLYAAARLASGNRSLAALLAIAWAVFSQGAWTGVIHHWLTTAASMASAVGLFVALKGAPGRGAAFAGGLFAGIAAMVTQTRGAVLCVAIVAVLLTLPGARSRLASAVAGIALFPTAMVLYLTASGTLAAAFDDVIRFPFRHYASIQPVPYGSWVSSQNWALVALFPVTFVLAAATLALGRGSALREPRFCGALALALVGVVGIFPRPDATHIDFTVPLAGSLFALVTTDLLGRLEHRMGRRARLAMGVFLIGLCLPGFRGAIEMAVFASRSRAVQTARGLVVPGRGLSAHDFAGDFAALVVQVDRTPPGDAFFFYPFCPMLPYLTGRRHVAAIDVMTPGYNPPEDFRETCARVVRDAQWVVIEHNWSDPTYLHMVFPAIRDPDPPEKRAFEAALRQAFDRVVHTSRFFELRQRAGTTPAALCDTIGARLDAR